MIVDADSVADEGLLAGLACHLDGGADAVQAQYLALEEEDSLNGRLRVAAFLLFHRTRFAGRAVLRLPCSLVGNGMLLSRRLLEAHPWTAYSAAEDLEYSVDLRLAGVKPVFAGAALVRGPVSSSGVAAKVQRQRWEGGRLRVIRAQLPSLVASVVRDRRMSLVDAAVDLAVPPLGILALLALTGAGATAALVPFGAAPAWLVAPWVIAVVGLVGYIFVGLAAAGATRSSYVALIAAPVFLVKKAVGAAGVVRASHRDTWIRTVRPSERGV